jgi:hypothetical protein
MSYAQSQSGWCLPNAKELASITDKTRSNPVIMDPARAVFINKLRVNGSN